MAKGIWRRNKKIKKQPQENYRGKSVETSAFLMK
jgi:hypothetical protein